MNLTPAALRELIGVGAILVTLLGIRLSWHAPRRRMSIEERAKDGLMTEAQARRRIRRAEWLGPIVTVAGFIAITVVLLG